MNPVVGATYSTRIAGSFRLAGFLGGDDEIGWWRQYIDLGASGADTAGIAARSGMDNSMFAVNYMAAIRN